MKSTEVIDAIVIAIQRSMLFDPLRRAFIVVQNGDARIVGAGIVRRGLIRREAVLRQCGNVNVVGVD